MKHIFATSVPWMATNASKNRYKERGKKMRTFIMGLASVMLTFGFVFPTAAFELPANWKQKLVEHHAQYPTVQVTYHMLDYSTALMTESLKNELRESLNEYSRVLQQRAIGELSAKDQKAFGNISNETLKKMIEERKNLLNEAPIDSVVMMTQDGEVFRKDIVRDRVNPKERIWLYDGIHGCLIMPIEKQVRTSSNFMQGYDWFWEFPIYGAGLHRLAEGDYDITVDEDAVTVTIENLRMAMKNYRTIFTLYEPNPVYWTECLIKQGDRKAFRFLCQDFTDVDGMLIPQIVKQQDWRNGQWVDEEVMSFVDAKVNDDVQLQEGFFETPSADSFEVVRLNR